MVVQHLDPTHRSLLANLLAGYTPMTVVEIEDGLVAAPDTVHVIPPNRHLTIEGGGPRTSIDLILQSLATDQEARAVCIILSGSGTEGAEGLKAVKAHGGLVMVQDPSSAQHDGMPRAAVATGQVDHVLPPERMPAALVRYLGHPDVHDGDRLAAAAMLEQPDLERVLDLLRHRLGHDFGCYKRGTITRRIQRRMGLHRTDRVADYADLLAKDPAEIEALFQDLLISVSSFFRDEEAWRGGGYLFLGNAETIGPQADLFEPVSGARRIYRRLGPTTAATVPPAFIPGMPAAVRSPAPRRSDPRRSATPASGAGTPTIRS